MRSMNLESASDHRPMYFASLIIPLLVSSGLLLGGPWALLTPIAIFGVGPILELLWKGKPRPHENPLPIGKWSEVAMVATAAAHVLSFAAFALRLRSGEPGLLQVVGWSLSVGMANGVIGNNLGHELCQRSRTSSSMPGQFLRGMICYMPF